MMNHTCMNFLHLKPYTTIDLDLLVIVLDFEQPPFNHTIRVYLYFDHKSMPPQFYISIYHNLSKQNNFHFHQPIILKYKTIKKNKILIIYSAAKIQNSQFIIFFFTPPHSPSQTNSSSSSCFLSFLFFPVHFNVQKQP